MNAVALLYIQTLNIISQVISTAQRTPPNYLQREKLYISSYFTVAHKETRSTINNCSSHYESVFWRKSPDSTYLSCSGSVTKQYWSVQNQLNFLFFLTKINWKMQPTNTPNCPWLLRRLRTQHQNRASLRYLTKYLQCGCQFLGWRHSSAGL